LKAGLNSAKQMFQVWKLAKMLSNVWYNLRVSH